jgi:hypothetical protein
LSAAGGGSVQSAPLFIETASPALRAAAKRRSNPDQLLKAFVWFGSQGECETFVRAGSQEEGATAPARDQQN